MMLIYAVVFGDEEDKASYNGAKFFTNFNKALETAKTYNEVHYWDMDPQNQRTWDPSDTVTEEQVKNLAEVFTMGLTNPKAMEIAETFMDTHGHWTDEDFGTTLINNIIGACMTHGILPHGWAGVLEVVVNDEEEE